RVSNLAAPLSPPASKSPDHLISRSPDCPTTNQKSTITNYPSSLIIPPTRYEHIIWDWNGTLLDDAWLCVEIMNSMLAKRPAIKMPMLGNRE
ncbi:MAG: hypothetical protein OEZ01_11285, partial [Candidatus Heimdallarchaeota archaeon]|nr:hypothetical protein [Candidatus Heimdallarchaeota archaeon]